MRKDLLTKLSVLMAATLAVSGSICPTGRVFAAEEIVQEDDSDYDTDDDYTDDDYTDDDYTDDDYTDDDSTSDDDYDDEEEPGTKISEISFTNSELTEFVKSSDIDNNGYISEYEAGNVTYLSVTKACTQSDLNKILDLYPDITGLRWNSGTSKSLTFPKENKLNELYITTKASQQVSVSGISKALDSLDYITVGNSKYTFSFSKSSVYKNAKYVNLSGKQIKGVKLSGVSANTLYISSTSVSQVNVSSAKITNFGMYGNSKLKSVTIKNCSKLEGLHIYNDALTKVNISGCPKLVSLSCDGNKLTKLDVSKFKNLKSLSCGGNKLTKLDVSKNSKLESLYCNDNRLTGLNTSKNKQLTYFNCSTNKIKKLSLSSNKKLNSLSCYSNKFTKVNLKKNKQLNYMNVSKSYKLLSSYIPSVSKYDTDYVYIDVKKGTKLNIVKYAPALKNAKFSGDGGKNVTVNKNGVISVKKSKEYVAGYVTATIKKKKYQIRVLGV